MPSRMQKPAAAAALPAASHTGAPCGIEPTAAVAKMKKIDPDGLSPNRAAVTAPAPDTSAVTAVSAQTSAPSAASTAPTATEAVSSPPAIAWRAARARRASNRP